MQRSSSSPCLPPSPTRDSSPFVSSSLEIRNFPPSHYHLSKDLSSESDSPAISPPRAKIDRPFHLSDKPIQMRPDSTEGAFVRSLCRLHHFHFVFQYIFYISPSRSSFSTLIFPPGPVTYPASSVFEICEEYVSARKPAVGH